MQLPTVKALAAASVGVALTVSTAAPALAKAHSGRHPGNDCNHGHIVSTVSHLTQNLPDHGQIVSAVAHDTNHGHLKNSGGLHTLFQQIPVSSGGTLDAFLTNAGAFGPGGALANCGNV